MVDMKGLQGGVVALAAIVITVVLGVVVVDQLGQTQGIGNQAVIVAQNGTDILGQVITTWGTIILLGLVVVFIFVGMLLALNLLNRTSNR